MCNKQEKSINSTFFEMPPEWDNIVKTYTNNPEIRKRSIDDLVRLICGTDYHCSIAIDGSWGSGKTFYVKHAKMLMDVNNRYVKADYLDETTKKLIKSKTNKSILELIEDKLPVCVYYDAWSNDDNDDPLLSLVYSIVNEYSLNFKDYPELRSILTELLDILKPFLPIKLYMILKLPFLFMGNDNYLNAIKNKVTLNHKINSLFYKLLQERGNRLIVFIDELDRCSPLFAIKLLERIKHYFTNDNITFVFSVNVNQLTCTVRKVYGSSFNAEKYLERFFDYTIPMPEFDMDYFCESLMFNNPFPDARSIINTIIKILRLNLREVAKFMRNVKAFTNYYELLQSSHRYQREQLGAIGYSFILLILPILGLISKDANNKGMLLSGNGFSAYYDLTSKIREYEIISKNLYEIDGIKFDEGFNITKMSKFIYDSFVKEYTERNSSEIPRFNGLNYIFKKALDFPSSFSNQIEPIVETNE